MPIEEEEVCVVVPTPEVQAECEPYTKGWMHASEEGRLRFRVLPFGLASAPTRFNTLVAECLGDIRFGSTGNNRKTCTNHIDDVYVAGVCTYEQHLDDLEECYGRLQNDGFAARMDKAEFVRHEISMLGWTIAKGTKSFQKETMKEKARED